MSKILKDANVVPSTEYLEEQIKQMEDNGWDKKIINELKKLRKKKVKK